jgi:hypothetical protein
VRAAIPDLRARLGASRGVLVDSNVLLDISTSDPNWSGWSEKAVAECAEHAALIINPIIYAEVSIGYTTIVSFRQGCVTQERMTGKFMKSAGGGPHETDQSRCHSGADSAATEAA